MEEDPYLPWRGAVSGKPGCEYGVAYTVKAENTDAEAATSNIKSILLIGQDKERESPVSVPIP